MEEKTFKRFLITTAIMLLVVIPFLSSAMTAKKTENVVKEPHYPTEEEINKIATFWIDHEDEVVECFEPIADFLSDPTTAPEILKEELGLDVSKLSVDYVKNKNSH